MAAGDGTNPPVLFVVGTAGAGKSTLVTAFQRWSRFLEVDVLAVNLDPGAERVHYDTEYDVRDLVSLSDVMDEYDLGPNGAQILAADLVAAQAYDIQDELDGLSGDLLIIDTPGQVELFAFREASNHLVEVLGQDRSALIFLFDPMLSRSASGFVSQMLLSNIVHFRLGQPFLLLTREWNQSGLDLRLFHHAQLADGELDPLTRGDIVRQSRRRLVEQRGLEHIEPLAPFENPFEIIRLEQVGLGEKIRRGLAEAEVDDVRQQHLRHETRRTA